MVTFGCNAILSLQNTLSAKYIRENANEECQTCPDGNRSKHLGSDWRDPNAADNDTEAAPPPKVISDTPSQYNLTE